MPTFRDFRAKVTFSLVFAFNDRPGEERKQLDLLNRKQNARLPFFSYGTFFLSNNRHRVFDLNLFTLLLCSAVIEIDQCVQLNGSPI